MEEKKLEKKISNINRNIAELNEAIQTRNFHLKMKPLHYIVTGLVAMFTFSSVVTYALQNLEEHLPGALLVAGVAIGFFYILLLGICEVEE